MKKLLSIALVLGLTTLVSAKEADKPSYRADVIPKKMTVAQKKARFYALLVPPVEKVYAELEAEYENTKKDIQSHTNLKKIQALKKKYKAKSDKELLMRMKPHPQSITLAQAAMESAWATSRFFREANNVFGVWSSNKNQKRIAAGEKRGGTRTIWLRKFDTIEDAVRAYYLMMSRTRTYKEFRHLNYTSNDVYKIVKGLRNYSERKDEYVKELRSMIRYNKLTKYDEI
ncbi:glucosaminidase domain-containing protein [Sulfurimonas sp.]